MGGKSLNLSFVNEEMKNYDVARKCGMPSEVFLFFVYVGQ
jgi:hypothetical protein